MIVLLAGRVARRKVLTLFSRDPLWMAVSLAAETINQGLVYGACWVVVYEVGSCVDNVVCAGVGLRAALLAVGMTSVFVVVACCVMGARVCGSLVVLQGLVC